MAGVAQTNGARHLRLLRQQAQESIDEVVEEAEGPRLGALAVDRDGLAPQRLDNEARHNASVGVVLAGAVGAKDPSNLDLEAVLAVVRELVVRCGTARRRR